MTQECLPFKQILFLKTHKTGSSTVANIFFRYGDTRDLTFALGALPLLGWPKRFRVSRALYFYRQPNFLCSHTRFNKKPMNWLFPPESSKYVTILRNPVDQFESAFNYFKLGKFVGSGVDPVDTLKKFLESPLSFYNKSFNPIFRSLARNPMMFDLGLSKKYFQNSTAVNEYIRFLDKEFDLIMIMDYFDESVVLMKRLLCWEIDDILYVKLNERLDKDKATSLSEEVKENIRRWNKADVLLFNYFNATFWVKVRMEGPGFYEDLSAFRQRKQEINELCLNKGKGNVKQRIYGKKFAKGYSTREDLTSSSKVFCKRFIRTEFDYHKDLRKKRMVKLASEVDKEAKTADTTSWNVANDLQYVPV